MEVDSDDSWSSDEDTTQITRGRIAPLEEVGPDEKGSLSHSGGPGAEIEEVVVQPDAAATSTGAACDGKGQDKPGVKRKPRVLGVPRTPTQREMDAHAATHLPHQPWCEVCMMGRARNSQHRRKREMEATEEETEKGVQLSLPAGTQEEEETAKGEPEEVLHAGPVPRVSMDYFYLSTGSSDHKAGGQSMSTKELQRQLRGMGKSDRGSRQDLVRRYDKEKPREGDEENAEKGREKQVSPAQSHASENPMMVMVDEREGNKYMRAVDHNGLEGQGDNSWLIKYMHEERKSWGHPGVPETPLY